MGVRTLSSEGKLCEGLAWNGNEGQKTATKALTPLRVELNADRKYWIFRNLSCQMSPVCRVRPVLQTWSDVSEIGLANAGVSWFCRKSALVNEMEPLRWVSGCFVFTDHVEAETPIPWPPDVKNWLIWKDPDAGKDWRQAGKGTTEDEMVGWHHQLDGHEFEWTLGVGDGQGGLLCCSPWGRKESGMTEQLNWTEYQFWMVSLVPASTQLHWPRVLQSQHTWKHQGMLWFCCCCGLWTCSHQIWLMSTCGICQSQIQADHCFGSDNISLQSVSPVALWLTMM